MLGTPSPTLAASASTKGSSWRYPGLDGQLDRASLVHHVLQLPVPRIIPAERVRVGIRVGGGRGRRTFAAQLLAVAVSRTRAVGVDARVALGVFGVFGLGVFRIAKHK